ncbi:hypothetical protein [Bradyrhizobium ottawaense]
MGDLSRRTLLVGTGYLFSSRTILLGSTSVTALIASNQKANAWVMAAIAVASVVAGLIAANNRSDGGAMALISASYELLQVALSKLDQIQTQVIEILQKIEQLPDEIDKRLRQQNTRRLQNELNAVVLGYVEKLNQKDPRQPFPEWRRNENTRRDIAQLLARLQKSRQELRTDGLVDPATTLVVSSLTLVEHSLLNILDYRPAEITATLKQVYLPWFEAILDPHNILSAADYTNSASKRLADLAKKASENPIGKQLGLKDGSGLLACVGVNDFTPAHNETTGELVCDGEPTSYPGSAATPHPVTKIAFPFDRGRLDAVDATYARLRCRSEKVPVPARVGPHDRLAQHYSLADKELVLENGKPSGQMLLEFKVDAEKQDISGNPGVPPDGNCEIVQEDIQDPKARLARMHTLSRWVNAQKAEAEFAAIIDLINTDRTRFAFGFSAMTAAETAKQNITQLVRQYG